MFSGEYASARRVWLSDPPGVLIGVVIGALTPALFVSARLTLVLLPLLLASVAWAYVRAHDRRELVPPVDGLMLSLAAFTGFALLSTTWADAPGPAALKVLYLAAVIAVTLVAVRAVGRLARDDLLRGGEGLWLGFLLGVTFYFLQAATNQSLLIWIVNTFGISRDLLKPDEMFVWNGDGDLIQIRERVFARNATPISLLVWSAVLAATVAIRARWSRWVAGLILALACGAIALSPQESSQTALVAGIGAWLLARASRVWSLRLIGLAWVAACLAILPVVLSLHTHRLHEAEWLPDSARHRVVIWNFSAEKALEAPILGAGAYSIYTGGEKISEAVEAVPGEPFKPSLSRHSHSVYLQTWVELGAVGAVLLAIAGVAVLVRLSRLRDGVRPYAFATFASAAAMMASSYGMWQAWFLALFALATVLMALAARLEETASSGRGSRERE